jgi:hypothetical protein
MNQGLTRTFGKEYIFLINRYTRAALRSISDRYQLPYRGASGVDPTAPVPRPAQCLHWRSGATSGRNPDLEPGLHV